MKNLLTEYKHMPQEFNYNNILRNISYITDRKFFWHGGYYEWTMYYEFIPNKVSLKIGRKLLEYFCRQQETFNVHWFSTNSINNLLYR